MKAILISAFLLCGLGSSGFATICNFDDLTTPPGFSVGDVPANYCGMTLLYQSSPLNGLNQGSPVGFFSGSFQGTLPHSQPNAAILEVSGIPNLAGGTGIQLSFNPSVTFNGFWVYPSGTVCWTAAAPCSSVVVYYLQELSDGSYYQGQATVPAGASSYVSSGYTGPLGTVLVYFNYLGVNGAGDPSAPRWMAVDDISYGPACNVSISSQTTNFSLLGGAGSATITDTAGCGWKATSQAGWITLTGDTSGTGTGSPQTVTFSVPPNTGGSRSGTITIGGLNLTITQAGSPTFTVIDTVSGVNATNPNQLGPIKLGEPLDYSGLNWPNNGNSILILWGATPIDIVSPPNFQQTTPFTPKMFGNGKSCNSTLTAAQQYLTGNLLISIPVFARIAGVVRLAAVGSTDGVTLISGPNQATFHTGDAICDGDPRDLVLALPHVSGEICVSGRCEPDTIFVLQNSSDGTIDVSDTETNVFTWGFPLTTSQSLTIGTDQGPATITGLYAGSPANVSAYDPSALGQQYNDASGGVPTPLAGIYRANQSLTLQGGLEMSNGYLYVNGDLTVNGDVTGLGTLVVAGNVTVSGKFMLQPAGANSNLITSGNSITLLGNATQQTSACSALASIRGAFGAIKGQPGYNAALDLNGDGVIDVKDAEIAAQQVPAGTVCQ